MHFHRENWYNTWWEGEKQIPFFDIGNLKVHLAEGEERKVA